MNLPNINHSKLNQLAYQSLLELATEEGINASSKEEIFGCIFGRDSSVTVLKILRTYSKNPNPKLLEISRRTLLTLATLAGKEFNIESGEQPGKFIHEYRKSKYEHLLSAEKPWFIYPDGILRNYDSVDSTPLGLIAIYKYWETTSDNEFLLRVLPAVEAGLNWIITYGDFNKDIFVEYDFPIIRQYGGLQIQSWTDSHETLRRVDGILPKYPIAPVEAQAFSWLALRLWAKFYTVQSPSFSKKLFLHAKKLKDTFNEKFIINDQGLIFAAQALDGDKNQIKTITSNPLFCLWAALKEDGKVESILDSTFIPNFVERVFMPDLFLEDAGIRTMSALSPTFNPHSSSYHNGSFWPMLNGLIFEGLENFGFFEQAQKLKQAALIPIEHFGCPIELYIKTESGYDEYCSPSGQKSCHYQAWSAAAILDMTS